MRIREQERSTNHPLDVPSQIHHVLQSRVGQLACNILAEMTGAYALGEGVAGLGETLKNQQVFPIDHILSRPVIMTAELCLMIQLVCKIERHLTKIISSGLFFTILTYTYFAFEDNPQWGEEMIGSLCKAMGENVGGYLGLVLVRILFNRHTGISFFDSECPADGYCLSTMRSQIAQGTLSLAVQPKNIFVAPFCMLGKMIVGITAYNSHLFIPYAQKLIKGGLPRGRVLESFILQMIDQGWGGLKSRSLVPKKLYTFFSAALQNQISDSIRMRLRIQGYTSIETLLPRLILRSLQSYISHINQDVEVLRAQESLFKTPSDETKQAFDAAIRTGMHIEKASDYSILPPDVVVRSMTEILSKQIDALELEMVGRNLLKKPNKDLLGFIIATHIKYVLYHMGESPLYFVQNEFTPNEEFELLVGFNRMLFMTYIQLIIPDIFFRDLQLLEEDAVRYLDPLFKKIKMLVVSEEQSSHADTDLQKLVKQHEAARESSEQIQNLNQRLAESLQQIIDLQRNLEVARSQIATDHQRMENLKDKATRLLRENILLQNAHMQSEAAQQSLSQQVANRQQQIETLQKEKAALEQAKDAAVALSMQSRANHNDYFGSGSSKASFTAHAVKL